MSDKKSRIGGFKRFPMRLVLNREHLQEDGRKLSVSAITAGLLGTVLRTDLILYQDGLMLVGVGIGIWALTFIEPISLAQTRWRRRKWKLVR